MNVAGRCVAVLFAGWMFLAPCMVQAYDAVGVFLNFPTGALDNVKKINVAIAPYPFGVSQMEPYGPAYKNNPAYISSVFPQFNDSGHEDYYGSLGQDWQRLTYVNGTQSYGSPTDIPPADPLQSENPYTPGIAVALDAYVYSSFPTIDNIELPGYPGSVQTRLSLIVADVPVEVKVGFITTTVKVNFWALIAEPDNTPPVIYLNGKTTDETVEWTNGVTYQDLGVTAEDNVDGAIPYEDLDVTMKDPSGSVVPDIDTHVAIGTTYTLSYSATDQEGNVSDTRTRTVKIVADRPPVIYLNGKTADDDVNVTKGSAYSDTGVTAVDDVEGDVSSDIEVRVNGVVSDPKAIDTSASGVNYILTYNVKDYLDQSAVERKRTVHVVDPPAKTGGGGGGGCFIRSLTF